MSFNFATAHYSLLTPEQVAALSTEAMTDLYNDAAIAVAYLRKQLAYLKSDNDWMETKFDRLETKLAEYERQCPHCGQLDDGCPHP